ncbi:MAG: hypothetical protein ACREBO_07365 [Novosphingobium sp.]
MPDDLSAEADRVAMRLGTTRSGFYRRALRFYLESMAPDDETTEALDALVDHVASPWTDFVHQAARRRLMKSDW